ncbi:MAG: hypothetical protein EBR30_24025 [Cytophagia bacterium]|jgi:hypothetical protein|nr:hypothetical protein [Cytophagia bacterium]
MEFSEGDVVILRNDAYQASKYRNKLGIILELDEEFDGYRILICGIPGKKIWFHSDSIQTRIYKYE